MHSTGPQLPPLGVGTWQWGDRRVWGYGRAFGEADVRATFQAAVQAGVHFFDTAELYGGGEAERLLGRFVRESGASVLVATKFLPLPWRVQRGSLLRALEGSLGRLRLPSVDLYQVHWPLPVVPVERWADELAEAVRSGMARAVGVSNYGPEQMQRTYAALERRGVPLTSNQVSFSLLERTPERSGLLAACQELGVRLIAYSPLAMGLLSGTYGSTRPLPAPRRLWLGRKRLARAQPVLAALQAVGEARGKTPAQVALNWVVAKGAVPIPGARSAHQAEQNAGALGWRLAEEELAALDRASAAA